MNGDKISLQELQSKMADPDVPESELRQYFIAEPEKSRAFAPAVEPDPNRVEVPRGAWTMNMFNSLARRRRLELFERRMEQGDDAPVLVSEGDSWFQFPVFLDDVIDQLSLTYPIYSLDAAGDTLQNMVIDNPEYLKALRHQKERVRAFVFSGAGNDIVGDEGGVPVIEKIVRSFTPDKESDWYVDTPEFEERLTFIESAYRTVLSSVSAQHPSLPVICHGYDYSLPGGGPNEWRHPRWAATDAWLGKPLRKKGITDGSLQCGIVRAMLDRLNEMLKRMCGGTTPGGEFAHAYHVDVRGVLSAAEWADELHPTGAGFAKVAVKFAEVLGNALGRTATS